jgi:hypothetical protein
MVTLPTIDKGIMVKPRSFNKKKHFCCSSNAPLVQQAKMTAAAIIARKWSFTHAPVFLRTIFHNLIANSYTLIEKYARTDCESAFEPTSKPPTVSGI